MNVHDREEPLVVTERGGRELIPARLEPAYDLREGAGIFARHAAHRCLDDRVVYPLDDGARHRVPDCSIQPNEESAVELNCVVEQAGDGRISAVESHEAWKRKAREAEKRPAVRDKDFVTITRDWKPWASGPELRPFPLTRMPVVVVQQHVDESYRQHCARIDYVHGLLVDVFEQVFRVDDIDSARERGSRMRRAWVLLDRAEYSSELLAKFTEKRIVRHQDDSRIGMEHVGGGEERRRCDGRGRVRGAAQVEAYALDDGAVEMFRHTEQSLVNRAEHILRAVGRHEPQVIGLLAAAHLGWPKATRKSSEIQNRHADRPCPEIAVVVAEE